MPPALTPALVQVVFVETHSTGRHSGTDVIGLHAAILSRRRVERSGESLIIEKGWPEEQIPQVQQRQLSDEYIRLTKNYGKEDVVAVYGELHTGRLRSVLKRIHDAFQAGMPVNKIIEIGNPDADGMELSLDTDAPIKNGITQGGMHTPHDPDDDKPSLSAVMNEIESQPATGAPNVTPELLASLILTGFLPKGATAADAAKKLAGSTGANPAAAPAEPAAIDAGDGSQDPPALDGALVEYLAGLGWQESDAMRIARLVSEYGIKSIADEPLKAMRTFAKPDARKQIRKHLADYDPKQIAATA